MSLDPTYLRSVGGGIGGAQGDRVRFTGQLIDASTGVHIWTDRFEEKMGNVFSIQDRFTESVVASIEPNLQEAEIERLKHRPPKDFNAYDHLLRAQQHEYEFTEESHSAALEHLEQALAIDPDFALAMALPLIASQSVATRVGRRTAKGAQHSAAGWLPAP